MVAVEFRKADTNAPDAERVNAIVQGAMAQGLLLLTCGMYGNVLRFLYPLTIEDALFDRALDILDGLIQGR
ncbi:4-aminobutyrate aminotransferase PuuE [compost metagenome]